MGDKYYYVANQDPDTTTFVMEGTNSSFKVTIKGIKHQN